MPTEEELQQYRRAREVLAEAGWVFDEFIKEETRKWANSENEDVAGREALFVRIRVAAELKTKLEREVEQFENTRKLAENREQRSIGGRDGRHARPN